MLLQSRRLERAVRIFLRALLAAEGYGPGRFLVLEGGANHYEWFRGQVTLHVEEVGPFRTIFLNRADHPRPMPKHLA